MRTAILLAAAGLLATVPALAADRIGMVSGQGRLDPERTFSVSARINADGTATGRATLINRSFSGDSGKGPYKAQIDITCAQRVGNTVLLGGFATRTNDSNLRDSVFFSVQDNGEPGAGRDRISRAFFFDDDPNTTDDNPLRCLLNNINDFPLETIESGNIQVH